MSARIELALKLALWSMLSFPAAVFSQGLAGSVSSVSAGAPLTTPGNLTKSAQVQAVKGSSSASVKYSSVRSFSEGDDLAVFNTLSVTGSAPLNKTGDDTTIANLDGLTNGASIEFGFTQFRAAGKRSAKTVISKLNELDAVCKNVYEARKTREGTAVPEKNDGCDSNLVRTYGSAEDIHAYESTFWNLDPSGFRWLWGGTAKLGYQDYEFLTANSTAKQNRNETPWAAGIWGAVQPGDVPWLFLANVQYQRTFKEGENGAVCPSPTASSLAVCATGAINAPRQITKKLLTLEVRGRSDGLGLSISVTHDFQAKVTGVDLPIYFVADKDGKLTAGVKAGWRSDTKKGSVGVFVGIPFGLYK